MKELITITRADQKHIFTPVKVLFATAALRLILADPI